MNETVKVLIGATLRGNANNKVEITREDYERLDAALDSSDAVERMQANQEILELLGSGAYDNIEVDDVDDFQIIGE